MEIAAAVEDGVRKIPDGEASELRGKVCIILRGAKPPKTNITKEQRRALKSLKEKVLEVSTLVGTTQNLHAY